MLSTQIINLTINHSMLQRDYFYLDFDNPEYFLLYCYPLCIPSMNISVVTKSYTTISNLLFTSFHTILSVLSGFHPGTVSTPYPNVAQQLQFTSPRGGSSTMLAAGGQEVIYSSKHRGLCLYLARILRLAIHDKYQHSVCGREQLKFIFGCMFKQFDFHLTRPLWESRMVKEFSVQNKPGEIKQYVRIHRFSVCRYHIG